MNNTFNLARFLSYFKKHSIDNGKTYLLSTTVLIGILVIALFFVGATTNGYMSIDWQMTVLMSVVLIGGSIFTSLTFSDLGNKTKAIPVLTLPVSHFEKYLVAWIYTYFIFLIVSSGAFYLVNSLAFKFSSPSSYLGPSKMLDLSSKETPGTLVITMFTLFHALAFWGAIYFDKLHFVKTAFLFFVCLISLNLINRGLLAIITAGRVEQSVMFQNTDMIVNGQRYFLPDNTLEKTGMIIFSMVILLLWASAFFKLKEKQV